MPGAFTHGLGALALVACISGGCSANGGIGHGSGDSKGTRYATSSSSGGSESPVDAGSDAGADSGIDGEVDAEVDAGPSSIDGGLVATPSCQAGGSGATDCGATGESCCASLEVPGGNYYRTYANSGGGPTGEADPASVSGFRLDKYEVTVGRFRQFAKAWGKGSGYLPPAGSGKHTHLNGGRGLVDGSAPEAAYEPGWVASDDRYIAPTDANLACKS